MQRWVLFSRCVALAVATSAVASTSPAFPQWLLVGGGVVLAVLTIANIVVDPGRLALLCRDQVRDAAELLARAPELSDADLRAAEGKLIRPGLPELKSLRIPVYNEVAAEIGREDAVREPGPLGRLFYLFA